MAVPTDVAGLLGLLSQSLESATQAAPKLSGIDSVPHGNSLLDVKNELLLAYLQNLVFLILVKIRNGKSGVESDDGNEQSRELNDSIVEKLVELRLYLEKGIRPVEEKLSSQIEKAIRAAEDKESRQNSSNISKKTNGATSDDSAADSEAASNDEEDSDSETVDDASAPAARSNLLAFRSRESGPEASTSALKTGAYRPPRINPTVMPTTEPKQTKERRPMKSTTMSEFIADELSTAPVAEPSIGTNIASRGRHTKTAADRAREDERTRYEEMNFVRLPKGSKKERAAQAQREGRSGRMKFGGEEWSELGAGVDRINRLVKDGKGGKRSTRELLESSRKRGRDTVDGPRGGDGEMGDKYRKRVKVQEAGGRRKR